jgi:oxygen-independent coproporphyrinogen-3 oxidase
MTTEAKTDEKTTVGNYFISNYPPYSFWNEEHVPDVMRILDSEPDPDTPLGHYVHIPFCRKRCHFCYFRVYTGKKSQEIREYIDRAILELQMYREKPYLAGRKPLFVYYGGGTPSYLSSDQLGTLTDAMREAFPWDNAEEVAFECEPGTLNEHKVKFIKELGITRLSLGVENLDDHILGLNGRAHKSKEILRAWDWVMEAGFPQVNVDLIAGMMDETEDNWQACVAKTIEMQPDSVTIYQMEIPYNTTIYKQMKAASKQEAPVADWATKRRWVDYAFSEFEKAGYTVTSAYTVVKDPDQTKFVYRDELWKGADLMSIGVASFGHLGGTHYQNEHHIEQYEARIAEGELPILRGLRVEPEEAVIRELILQFKTGTLDVTYFQDKFGVDIRERFADQLATFRDAGHFACESDEALTISRHCMLRIDSLLAPFFLEKHQHSRYA